MVPAGAQDRDVPRPGTVSPAVPADSQEGRRAGEGISSPFPWQDGAAAWPSGPILGSQTPAPGLEVPAPRFDGAGTTSSVPRAACQHGGTALGAPAPLGLASDGAPWPRAVEVPVSPPSGCVPACSGCHGCRFLPCLFSEGHHEQPDTAKLHRPPAPAAAAGVLRDPSAAGTDGEQRLCSSGAG